MTSDPFSSDTSQAVRSDERTLDALRGAHALVLDEPIPVPESELDPSRRRGGVRWLAIAAAVGLIGAATGLVAQQVRHPDNPVVQGVGQAADTLDAAPALTQTPGWKWVSVHGVTLQVPNSWGWRDETYSYCETDPDRPFVGMPPMATAPVGTGPNPADRSCVDDEMTQFALRFQTASGVRTVALHYDTCTSGNGVVAGDGHYHQLTTANCRDAMAEPVVINAAPEPAAKVCMRM